MILLDPFQIRIFSEGSWWIAWWDGNIPFLSGYSLIHGISALPCLWTWELVENPSLVMRCLEVDSETSTYQRVSRSHRSWTSALPQPIPRLSIPSEVSVAIGGSLCCAEACTSDHSKLTWSSWGYFPKSCWPQ